MAFLTIAYRALDPDIAVPEMVQSEVTGELALIEQHAGFADSPIFIYREDYSQYVPRGHYTRSGTLKRFFKAMMWYGRMTRLLKGSDSFGPAGDALIAASDARIQTLQAALLTLGLDRGGPDARLFRSFRSADWMRNLYWAWLYSFEPLLTHYGRGYPAFMRTMAWQDQQLHTALASWAELRHDTILYAKQSYTMIPTSLLPSPDRGYVEPVPEFYNRLLSLTCLTRCGLAALEALEVALADRLSLLETVLRRLVTISVAELEGRALTNDDYQFIECFGSMLQPLQSGLADDRAKQTTLIADVHTDNNSRQVLEEGVGNVNLLVAAYRLAEGRTVLGAGPVFSYYEFKWPLSDRLTDEKWTNMLSTGTAPAVPNWVHSFTHPVTLPPEDADGDGLADAWEVSNWGGLNVVGAAHGDFDGDGMSNLDEFQAGTDPREANSPLQIAPLRLGQTGLDLRWPGVAGRRYRVFFSEDLKNWYLLKAPVISEGGESSLQDNDAANARTRFYRVRLVPENDLNTPGWVNTGFAVVGTSAHSTIDIVPVESEQRLFRILRLH